MKHIDNLIERYPSLGCVKDEIVKAVEIIVNMHNFGGKLLLCGNGGSAADCEHISGELLKGFLSKRPTTCEELPGLEPEIVSCLQRGIAAVPLSSLSALSTAFLNDVSPENTFAQLVYALSKKNDVVLGLSTSGNSGNVLNALKTAKALGLTTIAFTGMSGGKLLSVADVTIRVPETETYKVQELHLPVYHAICAEVESILFG